jgi:hypothetical protein
MDKGPYAKDPRRLSDVLALLQVLSLNHYTHRSESGISTELQGQPSSATSWIEVARQHPEFFRIATDDENPVSLVARHVLPRDKDGTIKLPSDFAQLLVKTALELHDRQVKYAERWTNLVPIWVAAIASITTFPSVWYGIAHGAAQATH